MPRAPGACTRCSGLAYWPLASHWFCSFGTRTVSNVLSQPRRRRAPAWAWHFRARLHGPVHQASRDTRGTKGDAGDTPKYEQPLSDVADGKLDNGHAGLRACPHADLPVLNMDVEIQQAIAKGSSPAGRQRLESVLASLKFKESEADKVIAAASQTSGAVGSAPAPITQFSSIPVSKKS